MKTQHILLALSVSLAAPVAGCAATSAQEEASAPSPRELNQRDAIESARRDAARSYGSDWGSQPNVLREGGYWVVELHAKSGYTLRYAINARDGSIRERSMVQ